MRAGNLTVVAGNGERGDVDGVGGQLGSPWGCALNYDNTYLWVTDRNYHTIRQITTGACAAAASPAPRASSPCSGAIGLHGIEILNRGGQWAYRWSGPAGRAIPCSGWR